MIQFSIFSNHHMLLLLFSFNLGVNIFNVRWIPCIQNSNYGPHQTPYSNLLGSAISHVKSVLAGAFFLTVYIGHSLPSSDANLDGQNQQLKMQLKMQPQCQEVSSTNIRSMARISTEDRRVPSTRSDKKTSLKDIANQLMKMPARN